MISELYTELKNENFIKDVKEKIINNSVIFRGSDLSTNFLDEEMSYHIGKEVGIEWNMSLENLNIEYITDILPERTSFIIDRAFLGLGDEKTSKISECFGITKQKKIGEITPRDIMNLYTQDFHPIPSTKEDFIWIMDYETYKRILIILSDAWVNTNYKKLLPRKLYEKKIYMMYPLYKKIHSMDDSMWKRFAKLLVIYKNDYQQISDNWNIPFVKSTLFGYPLYVIKDFICNGIYCGNMKNLKITNFEIQPFFLLEKHIIKYRIKFRYFLDVGDGIKKLNGIKLVH